jgi:hypothetical protein
LIGEFKGIFKNIGDIWNDCKEIPDYIEEKKNSAR